MIVILQPSYGLIVIVERDEYPHWLAGNPFPCPSAMTVLLMLRVKNLSDGRTQGASLADDAHHPDLSIEGGSPLVPRISTVRTNKDCLVTLVGFEPIISALRGQCPKPIRR